MFIALLYKLILYTCTVLLSSFLLIFQLVTSADAYQVDVEVTEAQQKNSVIVNMLFELHQASTKVCLIICSLCLKVSLAFKEHFT